MKTDKWRMEYYPERRFSPLSDWVHQSVSDGEWRHSQAYKPPFPQQVIYKGFPYLYLPNKSYELEFASSYEI